MRVLHVTARADSGGGPEIMARIIADTPAGFEHHVACPEEPPYFARFRRLVGVERMISLPRRALSAAALAELAQYVREKRIDVVHSHGFGAGLYGRTAALAGRAAAVHTFHGFFPRALSWPVGLLKIAVECLLGAATARLIAVSHSEASLIRRLLPWLRSRLAVVPNGVATPAPPATPHKSNGCVRVLTVGRLVNQKNPIDVLRIARRCQRLDPDRKYFFRIAGGGPLHDCLESAIPRFGLCGTVSLAGALPDCRNEYEKADLYLSTSHWEGMPVAVLEAMSAGLPVVATRVMGNTDVVDEGTTGYLFEPGDTDVAARLITYLAANPRLRTSLGGQARSRAGREFDSAAMAGAYAAIYRKARGVPR